MLECDNLYLCQIINIQCVILIIGGREISRPYQNVGYRLEKFDAAFFTNKSFYHQGFFAVKRRAVFILGAMWIALVRGWRSDCVVGGMQTRFQ